jgi:hypothetical protein
VWPILITVAALLLVSLTLLGIAARGLAGNRDQLYLEIAKTALNLLFVGVAAMLAKTVVDRYVAARERERIESERHEAEARTIRARRLEALTSLTRSYWNTRKALEIIEAHRSAKSYGEHVRALIDHRLDLQQLDNEIGAGLHELKDAYTIANAIRELANQLDRVTQEWRDHYLTLSQLQKADELVGPEAKKVPAEIERLLVLGAVRANEFSAIHDPFERAANLIRQQVLLSSTRPDTPSSTSAVVG